MLRLEILAVYLQNISIILVNNVLTGHEENVDNFYKKIRLIF